MKGGAHDIHRFSYCTDLTGRLRKFWKGFEPKLVSYGFFAKHQFVGNEEYIDLNHITPCFYYTLRLSYIYIYI